MIETMFKMVFPAFLFLISVAANAAETAELKVTMVNATILANSFFNDMKSVDRASLKIDWQKRSISLTLSSPKLALSPQSFIFPMAQTGGQAQCGIRTIYGVDDKG